MPSNTPPYYHYFTCDSYSQVRSNLKKYLVVQQKTVYILSKFTDLTLMFIQHYNWTTIYIGPFFHKNHRELLKDSY